MRVRTKVLLLVGAMLFSRGVAEAQPTAYSIHGSSDLDMAGCSVNGPLGTISSTFWVLRRPDVAGPTAIEIRNLPTNVTAAVSPSTLTYPGWVTGERVTVTFTANGGVSIPDAVVNIVARDVANSVSSELLIHGTCPRHNRDFVMRGGFTSVQLGKAFPMGAALVEIYRDVPWQLDQRVGSAITDKDGNFEVRLWADDEDTYYAKLRLNDVAGVFLRDWYTPEIKAYNSAVRGSNSQPIIDLGGTAISRDGGQGTPRSAIWQGGHAAYQEFIRTFNAPPPTGTYELVSQNTISGMNWTARSTTNYEEGAQTYKFSDETPTAPTDADFDGYFSQFRNFSMNFHEFGHALRHTIDGDQRHFLDDAERWTYARAHDLCGSSSPGYVDTEAFAFNEGWGSFWSMDTGDLVKKNCNSLALSDMTKEGAVMNDLHRVAQAIEACLPRTDDHGERARTQRRNLYAVLNRGRNIIHSQGEFRSNASQQFPGCSIPPVGVGEAASPLVQNGRIPSAALGTLATTLRERISFYQAQRLQLAKELTRATAIAAESRNCRSIPCRTLVARTLRPAVLRGQISYLDLVGQAFARRYAEQTARKGGRAEPAIEMLRQAHRQNDEFRSALLKVVLRTLTTGAADLDTRAVRDTSGVVREVAADLRRTARRLQLRAPVNDELFTLLELPVPPDGERASAFRR